MQAKPQLEAKQKRDKDAHLNIRIDPELKRLAKRVAKQDGATLTEFTEYGLKLAIFEKGKK